MVARRAYGQLESIRSRLPQPARQPAHYEQVPNLLAIADRFDNFFFDAFGVLNVGQTDIPNAIATVAELRRRGKRLLVVSHASAYDKEYMVEKFIRLGFDFSAEEIVASRDGLLAQIRSQPPRLYGVIGPRDRQSDLAGLNLIYYGEEDFYERAEEILFLAAFGWDADQQERFIGELSARPRPIHLGNPDLIAPQGDATSIEAGSYMLFLPDNLQPWLRVYGKPFPPIFQVARGRIADFHPERTLMLGDTLHTDVLGANNLGLASALVSDWGFFQGLDWAHYIKDSAIVPNFVLPAL